MNLNLSMKRKNNPSPNTPSHTSQSGQAIVFIIGALATAFIFGVLASYLATTSIKKTAYTGQAEAALHAAEAGCRHALIMDPGELASCTESSPCSFTLGSGLEDEAAVKYWAAELGGGGEVYIVPGQVQQDETVQIDLTGLDGSDLTIYWCDSDAGEICSGSGNPIPALEEAVIYQSDGEYRLDRYALDYEARGNNFSSPNIGNFDPAGSGDNFNFSNTISSLPTGVAFIRLKPLYNDGNATTIAVQASPGQIPSQGLDIRCRGTVGASTRTVQVTKENPYLPSIFDYVLFSGTEITK